LKPAPGKYLETPYLEKTLQSVGPEFKPVLQKKPQKTFIEISSHLSENGYHQQNKKKPGIMVHTCNLSTREDYPQYPSMEST
jgi:hypothetical protein